MKAFISERLKEARLEKGLTMTQLAESAGITKAAISQFEKGITAPKYQTLLQLALVTGKDITFFYTPIERDYSEESPVFFRSFDTKSMKSQQIALVKKNYISDIIKYIFSKIRERKVDIPDDIYIEDPLDITEEDFTEIDALALRLRDHWDIGEDPIINLAYLFENKGIICSSLSLPDKIDAFSVNIRLKNSTIIHPMIIFDEDSSYYRQRFDIAHELGHIILHSMVGVEEFRENLQFFEKQSNRFASAFLLPIRKFMQTVMSTSINAILDLKKKWDVSMAAIIRRMLDLNLIDQNRYTNLNIELSKHKWRRVEPFDLEHDKERTYFLSKAFEFIINNNLDTITSITGKLGFSQKMLGTLSGNASIFKIDDKITSIDYSFSKS